MKLSSIIYYLLPITYYFAQVLTSNLPAWAANREDVERLLATNSCPRCDLSGAELAKADLRDANLAEANLKNANLRHAQ
ncbi:MAG: pentapeptide repeat-containing protein, partial [Spirulinaceae cyanobacterium]